MYLHHVGAMPYGGKLNYARDLRPESVCGLPIHKVKEIRGGIGYRRNTIHKIDSTLFSFLFFSFYLVTFVAYLCSPLPSSALAFLSSYQTCQVIDKRDDR